MSHAVITLDQFKRGVEAIREALDWDPEAHRFDARCQTVQRDMYVEYARHLLGRLRR